jgi:hypothetical protein
VSTHCCRCGGRTTVLCVDVLESTSVTEIRGPSGPAKHSRFTLLKGVPSRRHLAASSSRVASVVFSNKEIPDSFARPVQL